MNYFRVALAAMFGVLLQSNLMAADIDTSAEFAYVTDFASGKVLMDKDPVHDEAGFDGQDHDGLCGVSANCRRVAFT